MASTKAKLTEQEQDELLALHGSSKTQWRKKMATLIRENPDEYKVLQLGHNNDNHARHLTVSQFESAFSSLKTDLVHAIFDDIDNIDDKKGDGKLQITTIVRWVNERKLKQKHIIVKDEKWLYNKLKKTQFAQLDDNEDTILENKEFHDHFDKEGVDPEITDVIFAAIDSNNDKVVSIKEFFQWQLKFKQKDLEKLFPKQVEPEPQQTQEPQKEESWSKSYEIKFEYDQEPKKQQQEPKKEKEESWSKSYSIKFEAYDDNDKAPPKEEEAKKEESWSKSYSIKFEAYDDNDKAEKQPLTISAPKSDDDYMTPPQDVWVRSPTEKWRKCQVVEMLEDGKKWKIHYTGFKHKFDEVLDRNDDRLTTIEPENVEPKGSSKKQDYGGYDDAKRVWCQSTNNTNIHRECLIIDEKEEENEIKLRFISYHEQYDLWIDKNSKRLKKERPRGIKLIKGDNCSCWAPDFKAWLEVEVIECDQENDRCQVRWVGANKLNPMWLSCSSPQLSVKHKKHNEAGPQ